MGKVKYVCPLSNEQVRSDYFSWLCDLVNCGNKSYVLLFRKLHRLEFWCIHPRDDNRMADGKKMRERFWEEYDDIHEGDQLDGPCSVFEMLIGLANKMSEITNFDLSLHFWGMIENLNLDKFDDENYIDEDGEINETIEKWLSRKYKRDGTGGIFPIKSNKKDQRKIEIWYQMQQYLQERY